MLLIRNFFRRTICTKPAKRTKVKIPITPPISASEPVKLENGCTFIELNPKLNRFETLPPVVPNKVGRVIGKSEIRTLRNLHRDDPSKWTLTQLSKQFKVSRSFVIKSAFSKQEKQALRQEIDDMIMKMTIKEKKGWIIRRKIRDDREKSWP